MIGSDIDSSCFGSDKGSFSADTRGVSKNNRFKRKMAEMDESQANGSVRGNFDHYNLSTKLISLISTDAINWTQKSFNPYPFIPGLPIEQV